MFERPDHAGVRRSVRLRKLKRGTTNAPRTEAVVIIVSLLPRDRIVGKDGVHDNRTVGAAAAVTGAADHNGSSIHFHVQLAHRLLLDELVHVNHEFAEFQQ